MLPETVRTGPLATLAPIQVGERSTAMLLAALGASLAGGVAGDADPGAVWAESGAMALTGRPDGPTLHSTGQPATVARAAVRALDLIAARPTGLDGVGLLGERAAILGLRRGGDRSAGGSARLLRAADGWLALSLARPTDIELLPALIEGAVGSEHWDAVRAWVATRTAAEATERAGLLGLPVSVLPAQVTTTSPWTLTDIGPRPATIDAPLVVNLGALWAAPLAAHLLRLCGAHIVDVESTTRPDASRDGTPEFYELLHAGNERRTYDFAAPADRAALTDLLHTADLVLEASRPRALEGLGIHAASILSASRRAGWVRITGHGRALANRVGFGDDAAVGGGLIAWDADGPVFAGDAIADPLTGILAALAATAALASDRSWLIDLSLRRSAAYSVGLGPTTGVLAARDPWVPAR